MVQLAPVKLDDGTTIYIEASDDVKTSKEDVKTPRTEETVFRGGSRSEESFVPKGGIEKAIQHFNAIEGTIRSYTTYTLNAFKELAVANVEKVTLEFGIKVGGEAGIPYVTKGTAESNLKITVECSFPDKT